MAVDDALLSKVTKYGKLIKKKEKIPHVLSRLNEVEMTLDILSATNIGRYVNRLCDDPQYGREASKIIEKWKEVARQSGVRGGEEDASSGGEEAQQQRKSSPPKRVGLLNGVKEVKARSRDDDLDLEDPERNDYHREDSEMRYREKYSNKNDRKRAHNESDEESYKISRHSAHREDDDRRRRHDDDDAEERGDGDRHRHRSHHGDDRRKKKRDVEVEPTKKRKPREDRNQRWADSDEDRHSDSFQSGSNPAPERSAVAMYCQNSNDHHKSSGEITSSSDNDDMEDVRSCEKEASPIRRESSASDRPSRKDASDRRAHSSHATHKSSSSSSTKLSKSGSKSKERNPPR